MKRIDLVGQKFGRLTVVSLAPVRKNGQAVWFCRCDCGNEKAVSSYVLRSGVSKSCGCLRVEHGRAHGATAQLRHGEGGNGKESIEYRAWGQMLTRCESASHKQFDDYGGRGITVCERWHRFENFLADMGRRPPIGPEGRYSLDRIDVDGDYKPGNCRWATCKQQNRNQRKTVHTTIDGVTKPFQEWLEQAGITRAKFYRRVATGMSTWNALFGPDQT